MIVALPTSAPTMETMIFPADRTRTSLKVNVFTTKTRKQSSNQNLSHALNRAFFAGDAATAPAALENAFGSAETSLQAIAAAQRYWNLQKGVSTNEMQELAEHHPGCADLGPAPNHYITLLNPPMRLT